MTRRIAELEHKIGESERDRHRLRQDRDSLAGRLQELQLAVRQQAVQEGLLGTLRRSQEALEAANQRLEEALGEGKRRFREREEAWEAEMQGFRDLLRH